MRRPRRSRIRLFVPSREVGYSATAGLLAALLLAPAYAGESWWLGLGIAAAVFVAAHSAFAAYRTVWIPGVVTCLACVQWVLAAWSDYQVPGRMAVDAPDYFRFAVPTTIAYVLGFYLPLWRAVARAPEAAEQLEATTKLRLERSCVLMVIGGALTRVLAVPLAPTSIRYAVYMVGMLSLVGALGLILLGARRWPLWCLAAFAPIVFSSATDLQFLDSFQYVLCVSVVVVYRFRPKRSLIALLSLPVLAFFLAVSAFKAYNRDDLRKQEQTPQERARTTSTTVASFARQPTVLLGNTVVQRTMGRLNEGWITSRMLAWMPIAEPFAGGETLIDGVRAALLPRVLDPGKFVSGGHDMIPRFTGIELEGSTAMGLSVPGEMYANFGPTGAVVGTFVYAFVLGLIYRTLLRKSEASIMWWAWVPYLLNSILSPEQGFAENANHLAKSALIMWAFVRVIPAWRCLSRRQAASRRAAAPDLPSMPPTLAGPELRLGNSR